MYDESSVNQVMKTRREQHRHPDYSINLDLGSGRVLNGFSVNKGVFRPEVTPSILLANWLAGNQELLEGKPIIELGCGSGIHSIISVIFGKASNCRSGDLSQEAVNNTRKNVYQYGLADKIEVYQSDLFESIPKGQGLVIFNHPFFSGLPDEEQEVSRSWRGGTELIHRFFEEAKDVSGEYGIIMPFWKLAGDWNDPSVQGLKHGYKIINSVKLPNYPKMPGEQMVYHLLR